MRESIGGAWLFGIVIIFIFFFSAFLAYSISYTKAFNVKNNIISFIEQNEGYNTTDLDLASLTDEDLNKTVEGRSYKLIRNAGYNYSGAQGITCDGTIHGVPNMTTEGGYCIVTEEKNLKKNEEKNIYHQNIYYIFKYFFNSK